MNIVIERPRSVPKPNTKYLSEDEILRSENLTEAETISLLNGAGLEWKKDFEYGDVLMAVIPSVIRDKVMGQNFDHNANSILMPSMVIFKRPISLILNSTGSRVQRINNYGETGGEYMLYAIDRDSKKPILVKVGAIGTGPVDGFKISTERFTVLDDSNIAIMKRLGFTI